MDSIYTVTVIRKDGKIHTTKFEGYGAEPCADDFFRSQEGGRHTLCAVLFHDDTIRSQFNLLDATI